MRSLSIVKRLALLAILTLAIAAPQTMAQATTNTINVQNPINISVFIPCAGEIVTLSGDLHTLIHVTQDGRGGTHLKIHNQPQGITGEGEVTGDKYQGTGVTQREINSTGGAFEFTFVNNFRIIGQGTGNNFLVHATLHVTVSANGDVTANVVNTSTECK
jgi:hypothetical protein